MLKEFREFTHIGELDGGKVQESVNIALRHVMESCANLPWVKKARELTIRVRLTPVASDNELDSVQVVVTVDHKTPCRQSSVTCMGVSRDGRTITGLSYDDLSRGDAHQQTMSLGSCDDDDGKDGT